MDVLLWGWAVLAWLSCALAAGRVAGMKGHGQGSAILGGLFFGPLFGLLYAAALPDRKPEKDAAEAEEGERSRLRKATPHLHRPDGHGYCSLCQEPC